jgi:ATP-binding cassette subfamily C protein LapB
VPETNSTAPVTDWNLGEDSDRNDDPLLDCLMLLAKLHGRPASRAGLTAGLPLVQNRLTVELFLRSAERADMSARIVKRPLNRITQLQLPAVVLLHNREACVLAELSEEEGTFRILFPETGVGQQNVTQESLDKLYTGHVIFVRPKFRFEKEGHKEPVQEGVEPEDLPHVILRELLFLVHVRLGDQ